MIQTIKTKTLIFLFLISILLFGNTSVFASETDNTVPEISSNYDFPEKTGSFYVRDDADVLTDEMEDLLLEESRYYDDRYGLQIVVMTLPSGEYDKLDDYGKGLVDFWELNKTNDLSFLLLLDIEGENYYATCGSGIAPVFVDPNFPDFIVDNLEDSFQEEEYQEGVMKVMDKTFNLFEAYSKNLEVLETAPEKASAFSVILSTIVRVILIIILIILTIFVILYARYKMILEKRRKIKEHARRVERHKNRAEEKKETYGYHSSNNVTPISPSTKYDFDKFR